MMSFNLHKILYVIKPLMLFLPLLFVGCTLLVPPPNHILSIPSLNERGDVIIAYQKNISMYDYFERDNYIITSISITEHSCIEDDCYPKAWETSLPRKPKNIYKEIMVNHSEYFPKVIVYGKKLKGYEVLHRPKELKVNIPYSIIIGIHGFDEGEKNDVYFSADSYFMLVKDKFNENRKLLVWGKDGVKFYLRARQLAK